MGTSRFPSFFQLSFHNPAILVQPAREAIGSVVCFVRRSVAMELQAQLCELSHSCHGRRALKRKPSSPWCGFVCLSICLSLCLSTSTPTPTPISISLSISIYLSLYPSIYLSPPLSVHVCVSGVSVCVNTSTCLYVPYKNPYAQPLKTRGRWPRASKPRLARGGAALLIGLGGGGCRSFKSQWENYRPLTELHPETPMYLNWEIYCLKLCTI